MNQWPLVSIIIPTYNRENLLKEAILSVLAQTYKNFELIVVDDYSQDNTREVVENFKDDRIIYLKHNENRGVSGACNTGIKKAAGDYIFILNDDDLIVPWALEKFVEKMRQSNMENLGGVYGWSWWVDSSGKTFTMNTLKKRGDIFNILTKKKIFTNSFVKKEVFGKVGLYDENLKTNEDLDFYLRMAKEYQFDFVPEILYVKRLHRLGHLSNFNKAHIDKNKNVFDKYFTGKIPLRYKIASILPNNLYVKISKIKNYLILKITFFLHPVLIKDIKLIRQTLKKNYIKI